MFGRNKRQRHDPEDLPERFPEAVCAYVRREEPTTFNGVDLPTKLPRIDDLFGQDDLFTAVTYTHGRGKYIARLYLRDDKRAYVATMRLDLPGEGHCEPLIEGRRIPPPGPSPEARELAKARAEIKGLKELVDQQAASLEEEHSRAMKVVRDLRSKEARTREEATRLKAEVARLKGQMDALRRRA